MFSYVPCESTMVKAHIAFPFMTDASDVAARFGSTINTPPHPQSASDFYSHRIMTNYS
jgi:hypothetical protein